MTAERLQLIALGQDPIAWDEWAAAAGDVYYQRDYLAAAARHEDGELLLVCYRGADGLVLYPLVRRPLEVLPLPSRLSRGRFDLITPYEYGGPLAISEPRAGPALRAGFLREFDAWCRDCGVVSEFVRFHPLLSVQSGWEGIYDLRSSGSNVVIDLERDDEAMLASMRGATRRAVAAARRRGCEVHHAGERSADFAALYWPSMDRLDADDRYYFSQPYFAEIAALGGHDRLAVTLGPHGQPAAAALFVAGRRFAHYHLAAVDRAHGHLNPGHLLIHEAARRFRDAGRRWLHLGGAAAGQTGLRAFKEGFSPDRRDYVIGGRVHDAAAYGALAAAAGGGGRFFPAYRDFSRRAAA